MLVSLGCPKNLVDSETMLAGLAQSGFITRSLLEEAQVAVINTCAFIGSAREEADEWIRRASDLKRKGKLRGVVVAGCLPALWGERVFREFPDVDAIVGPRDRARIAEACSCTLGVGGKRERSGRVYLGNTDRLVRAAYPRAVSTGGHTAFLKISEGCNNRCSYCLIPRIRGALVSRATGSLVREAAGLAKSGVRELSIVAQDTTAYGLDLYGRASLPELLRRLSRVDGLRWLRLLYTHPAHWSEELMQTLAENAGLCKYADVPIQHVSDKMLRFMGRRLSQKKVVRLLTNLRRYVPDVSLRTTVMVGFPGESRADFSELTAFLKEFRFEHLGAFAYSREEGTRAARLPHQVPEEIKAGRLREIMSLQREICASGNRARVGASAVVLVDKAQGDGRKGAGRTQWQAPEIDGIVRIRGSDLRAGEFYRVEMEGSGDYDLFGKALGLEVFSVDQEQGDVSEKIAVVSSTS
ncbi:MAG: 30S ribosomal protein S12 methylthiotransferase RimO [Candidatus Eisenbacteria bacterium]